MEDFYFVCDYDISSSLFFILLVLKEDHQINCSFDKCDFKDNNYSVRCTEG